jgi:hypothetical protein
MGRSAKPRLTIFAALHLNGATLPRQAAEKRPSGQAAAHRPAVSERALEGRAAHIAGPGPGRDQRSRTGVPPAANGRRPSGEEPRGLVQRTDPLGKVVELARACLLRIEPAPNSLAEVDRDLAAGVELHVTPRSRHVAQSGCRTWRPLIPPTRPAHNGMHGRSGKRRTPGLPGCRRRPAQAQVFSSRWAVRSRATVYSARQGATGCATTLRR